MDYQTKYIKNALFLRQMAKQHIKSITNVLDNLNLKDIKNILIINAPPRSGSSLIYKLLSKSSKFCHLNGESTPFYRLNLINYYNLLNGDVINYTNIPFKLIKNLSEDFLFDTADFSNKLNLQNKLDREIYALKIIMRLILQWPNVEFEHDKLFMIIIDCINNYCENSKIFNLENLYLILLQKLMTKYPQINPYYYDISAELIEKFFPRTKIPIGPPNKHFLIEEPPFILIPPLRLIEQNTLSEKVLLLKTSIDVYNLNLIKKTFPFAKIKQIFLLRNPAASINGLIDGWLYRGFFSHNLKSTGKILYIDNYTNNCEFSKYWWNFDLPPNWVNHIDKPLSEVCAFQWYSSVKKILELSKDVDFHNGYTVKFEEIIRNLHTRTKIFGDLFQHLYNCPYDIDLNNMPIIQATKKPAKYRWKSRWPLIQASLCTQMLDIAKSIGYTLNNLSEWL